jgi:hypothetical protein
MYYNLPFPISLNFSTAGEAVMIPDENSIDLPEIKAKLDDITTQILKLMHASLSCPSIQCIVTVPLPPPHTHTHARHHSRITTTTHTRSNTSGREQAPEDITTL